MHEPDTSLQPEPEKLRRFTLAVLRDLRALDRMIGEDRIESGVRRIGVEQELVLVNRALRPAPLAMEILDSLGDSHYTTELGRYNLEINLEPIEFGGECLSRLESLMRQHRDRVRAAAAKFGADVVLTGILPTLRQTDLGVENMSPVARYRALNAALKSTRGADFELRLRGIDEINVKHDSVMLESCNTSCQFHFQVASHEFARLYNIAQLVAAPVVAAACNSPLLFGKRLWRETRIAVFEQSIDTRTPAHDIQDRSARVSFGHGWVRDSILEIYQDDITRFRVFLALDVDQEDPLDVLARGEVPRLRALSLHNGTVYRWNRPCYGVTDGTAQLRIENRVLPAGPTILDEVANAAFWYGLVSGLSAEHEDITREISFDSAKANFVAAARLGLDAHLMWLDGRKHLVAELIQQRLLPLADRGLRRAGIVPADVDRYLGVIGGRVATRTTGAEWMMRSLTAMSDQGTRFERLRALVAAMSRPENEDRPIHEWPPANIRDAGSWRHNYDRIGQFMTTDLITVHPGEVIDLVASVMAWRNVRHVPVEDDDHRLVGLISSRSLMRYIADELPRSHPVPLPVSQIMETDPLTVTPETPTLEAIELMRTRGVTCLPVIKDERLVGIVSEHDFISIAENLLRDAEEGQLS